MSLLGALLGPRTSVSVLATVGVPSLKTAGLNPWYTV